MKTNLTSRPSSNTSDNSSSHNNVDIDDILHDLQQLSSPIVYSSKGNHNSNNNGSVKPTINHNSYAEANSGFDKGRFSPSISTQNNYNNAISRDGIAGNNGTSFFSNYPLSSSNDSYHHGNNNNNPTVNTSSSSNHLSHLQPHPPKNRSPVQVNPKNKFAVLPENSSRGVSPLTVIDGTNNQNQSLNTLPNSRNPSSTNSPDGDSLYSFTSSKPYKTAGEITTQGNNHSRSNSGGGGGGTSYQNNSTPLFSSPPTANNNHNNHSNNSNNPHTSYSSRGLPEIDKSIAITSQNKSRSARNSFDEKAFQNIFEELNLNDRPTANFNLPFNNNSHQTHNNNNNNHHHTNNHNQLKSVSNDSWDEDSYDSKGKTNSFSIPKVKGSQSNHNNNVTNNSSSFPYPSSSSNNNNTPTTTTLLPPSKLPSTSPSSGISSSTGKTRCSKVILAGSHLPRGLKSSAFSKVACDALLCSQCNFKVLSFLDSAWDASTDYMFLRNNMPNVDKLQNMILFKEGHTAYCCQCQWCDEKDEKALTIGNLNEPKWICAGHNN